MIEGRKDCRIRGYPYREENGVVGWGGAPDEVTVGFELSKICWENGGLAECNIGCIKEGRWGVGNWH